MTNRMKSATATKAPVRKSVDELEADYAVARDIISQYFAMTASELSAEKNSKSPSQDKVEQLESRLKTLHQEKMQLCRDNFDLITKVFTTYVPLVKQKA
ncbi:MAG: hypothetical protein K2X93_23925 [Candidatus Obscuribacterales bacterium]|nr:hypothetical protein [Candidatus Obscuribacterales bacterium]